MTKREHIIILILITVIFVIAMLILSQTLLEDEKIENSSTAMSREVISNSSNDPGSVEVIRNIGNSNSSKKIAYVVGLHPLEYQTHRTLVNQLPKMTNLSYCYDVYIVNVTEDVGYYGDGSSDDSPGRQNGQNLAYRYVYPQIVNGSYDLAVDVHSNVGAYPYKTFVFSPVKEGLAGEYAGEVANMCENISYYTPDSTTSGPYLTIPLNEKGIPAFYFEEYSFAPQDVKDAHMMELIRAIDGLSFT
ncbi:hypothetical protein [Methanobrevibacter sp.]|uniref:hypothetical protein n=1 Tax=Methanobrevibacter sp. TaxID=66852 RepID=UPI00388E2A28